MRSIPTLVDERPAATRCYTRPPRNCVTSCSCGALTYQRRCRPRIRRHGYGCSPWRVDHPVRSRGRTLERAPVAARCHVEHIRRMGRGGHQRVHIAQARGARAKNALVVEHRARHLLVGREDHLVACPVVRIKARDLLLLQIGDQRHMTLAIRLSEGCGITRLCEGALPSADVERDEYGEQDTRAEGDHMRPARGDSWRDSWPECGGPAPSGL